MILKHAQPINPVRPQPCDRPRSHIRDAEPHRTQPSPHGPPHCDQPVSHIRQGSRDHLQSLPSALHGQACPRLPGLDKLATPLGDYLHRIARACIPRLGETARISHGPRAPPRLPPPNPLVPRSRRPPRDLGHPGPRRRRRICELPPSEATGSFSPSTGKKALNTSDPRHDCKESAMRILIVEDNEVVLALLSASLPAPDTRLTVPATEGASFTSGATGCIRSSSRLGDARASRSRPLPRNRADDSARLCLHHPGHRPPFPRRASMASTRADDSSPTFDPPNSRPCPTRRAHPLPRNPRGAIFAMAKLAQIPRPTLRPAPTSNASHFIRVLAEHRSRSRALRAQNHPEYSASFPHTSPSMTSASRHPRLRPPQARSPQRPGFEIMNMHTRPWVHNPGSPPCAPSRVNSSKWARDIALTHHDNSRKRAYPTRLVGKSVPSAPDCLRLADVYDALRSNRV